MDDELRGMLGKLLTVVESTRSELAELRTEVTGYGAKLTQLQADVSEIKHVTSTNHIRLGGRVDQIAGMMMEHMVNYHSPDDRKRA